MPHIRYRQRIYTRQYTLQLCIGYTELSKRYTEYANVNLPLYPCSHLYSLSSSNSSMLSFLYSIGCNSTGMLIPLSTAKIEGSGRRLSLFIERTKLAILVVVLKLPPYYRHSKTKIFQTSICPHAHFPRNMNIFDAEHVICPFIQSSPKYANYNVL